jgi:pyrroline-5-carboxylate reductase
MLTDRRIGFLGAGNMAEALCRGMLRAKLLPPERIIAADVKEERRRLFADQLGVKATADNLEAVRAAEIVVLAVKPQSFDVVMSPLGRAIDRTKLLISILAGVRTVRLEKACAPGARVIRAMPNAPVLVGAGMTALSPGAGARPEDLETAAAIFRAAGRVITVAEAQMDAVTAVSGSGPAYCFYLVEAMTEAGIAEGLAPADAALLAGQTLYGAGRLLMESGESAAALRAKVTSPGGTTQAAIEHMQKDGVKEALVAAVRRAAARSRELASG